MKVIISVFLFLGYFSLFGQNMDRIDSLKNAISRTNDDTKKIDLLVTLGEEYSLIDYGSDSLIHVAEELMALSQKVGDHCNEAIAYHYKGNYFYYKTDLDEALIEYKMSLKIREEHCEPTNIASSTMMLGNVYSVMANYEAAYKNCS